MSTVRAARERRPPDPPARAPPHSVRSRRRWSCWAAAAWWSRARSEAGWTRRPTGSAADWCTRSPTPRSPSGPRPNATRGPPSCRACCAAATARSAAIWSAPTATGPSWGCWTTGRDGCASGPPPRWAGPGRRPPPGPTCTGRTACWSGRWTCAPANRRRHGGWARYGWRSAGSPRGPNCCGPYGTWGPTRWRRRTPGWRSRCSTRAAPGRAPPRWPAPSSRCSRRPGTRWAGPGPTCGSPSSSSGPAGTRRRSGTRRGPWSTRCWPGRNRNGPGRSARSASPCGAGPSRCQRR